MKNLENLFKEFNVLEKEQFNLINSLVKKTDQNSILEIGSGWGLSACALLADNNAQLITIDPNEILTEFDRRTKSLGVNDRIKRIIGRSGPNCKSIKHQSKLFNLLETFKEKFDFIYIDGSHNYEDVKYDLEKSLSLIKPNGIILLDDYAHKENFGGSYGVGKAVFEVAKSKFLTFKVHPNAHGMAEFNFS